LSQTDQNLRWLYAGRALRSLSTAFLTVVFPLYLAQSGYSASKIGVVLSLSAALNIALVAAVGLLADRYGRRMVLIGLSTLSALAGITLALTSAALPLLVVASGLGGVGRGGGAGSGGGWGPVLPVEQPLVAASARENSTLAFGRLSFIGVMASAVGSLIAAVPAYLLVRGVPLAAGYRLLFGLSGALSVGLIAVSVPIRDHRADPSSEPPPAIPLRSLLGRLGLTNALNGFGFGFLGPLLTYWFYRRYGMGAAELAVLYTVVNLITAVPYLASSLLVERIGQVRTVVVTRIAGVLALAVMPFMPSAAWAGAMYALRMGLNSLGMPARQSFSMDAAQDRYRSRVAAFSSLPSQVTSMISPAVGGAVMGEFLNFPIFGAAFFMLLNGITYYLAFAHSERSPRVAAQSHARHTARR
jgi:MFS family permease